MYVIAVNKSQEFLLNVRRLLYFFFDDVESEFATLAAQPLYVLYDGVSRQRMNWGRVVAVSALETYYDTMLLLALKFARASPLYRRARLNWNFKTSQCCAEWPQFVVDYNNAEISKIQSTRHKQTMLRPCSVVLSVFFPSSNKDRSNQS